MKPSHITGITAALFCLATGLQAQISMPSVFSDGMVLQQKSNVPVWGWGITNSTIRVVGSWAPNDTATTVVNSDGSWKTLLQTAPAGGPYTLSISGDGSKTLSDVMLGEVWLCSGQSNMEWSAMSNINDRDAEIAAANHPDIHIFHIPKRGADYPQNNCDAAWATCTPDVMKNTSAIAYFFGRKLQKELNVPIGLIVSAWGGTPAEVWTPREAVLNNKELAANKPTKPFAWWPIEAGSLYNQMIHPVVPFSLAGSIWYQGESNQDRASSYGLLMKTMIENWRRNFGKDFPFYLVQIAPFTYNATDNGPARIREAQEWVTANVPQTGLVVVSDLVNDVKNIHPTDKQNVGLRLANLALGEHYGKPLTGIHSPLFHKITIDKNKAILSFSHTGNGLVCSGKQIIGLQIAGADGQYVEAKGQIKGNQLVVTSPKVKQPVAVRYCFDDATIGNLFSTEGLPVAPFRTDREW